MSPSSQSLVPVSVVMSVFDKPHDVQKTIDSVLMQEGVNLEFIIVSDGASEEVEAVLGRYRDERIRVIRQHNQGLTKALIKGCDRASEQLIARIDAGDEMLPDRLRLQASLLQSQSDVAFVSCWVAVVTDDGLPLYDVKLSGVELTQGLTAQDEERFLSPIHASIMFRKSAYQQAGGYREQFYYTQDCDLWSRLIEVGKIEVIPQVLQKIIFSASGISGRNKTIQTQLAKLVVQANVLRGRGMSDAAVLEQAVKLRPSPNQNREQGSDISGNYFIASTLMRAHPKAALKYWVKVLRQRPLHLRAIAKFAITWIRSLLNT